MGNTWSTTTVTSLANTHYLGCYVDLQDALNGSRLLPQVYFEDSSMSIARCATYMAEFKYWGVEYAHECWGSDSLIQDRELRPDSECNYPCAGNYDEFCGTLPPTTRPLFAC